MKKQWIFMSPLQINENHWKTLEIYENQGKVDENQWHANGHEQDSEQDVTRLREQGNLQEACGNSFN